MEINKHNNGNLASLGYISDLILKNQYRLNLDYNFYFYERQLKSLENGIITMVEYITELEDEVYRLNKEMGNEIEKGYFPDIYESGDYE